MIKQTQTGNIEMDFDTFASIVKLVAHATEKPTSGSVYCEAKDLQTVRSLMEKGGYKINAITSEYHHSLKIARVTYKVNQMIKTRDALVACVEENKCICAGVYESMKSMDSHNGRIEHYNGLISKNVKQIEKLQKASR